MCLCRAALKFKVMYLRAQPGPDTEKVVTFLNYYYQLKLSTPFCSYFTYCHTWRTANFTSGHAKEQKTQDTLSEPETESKFLFVVEESSR